MIAIKFKEFALWGLLLMSVSPLWGQQWARVEALPEVQITALHSNGGDTLFAAGPVKVYFTYNAGMSWDSSAVLAPNLEDYLTDILEVNGKIYVGTVNDGVFVSTNGGHTFQADNAGLAGLGAHSISMLAIRGDSIYAATSGAGIFVKKLNGTANWSAYNTGIAWSNAESIVNDNGTLIAGVGANATLYIRPPGANAWTERPFAVFNGEINAFLGAIRDGGVLLGAGMQGFYRSFNNGETWEHFNHGAGLISAARFLRNGNRTYVLLEKSGLNAFLFYTDNEGESWQLFQPDLGGAIGYDLARCGEMLFVGHANGLWFLPIVTDAQETPIIRKPVFEQIFPNPAFAQTSLQFTLQQASPVVIALYDLRGSLVRAVNLGNQPAGTHIFEFSTTNLPSGLYNCTLITSKGKEVKALSVVDYTQRQ